MRRHEGNILSAAAIRVLLTEDVAADAELELRELKRAGLRVSHRVVCTEESFVAALREFAPDIILSDFSMPGFDGMAALGLARELSPETPFVFVSGTIGEEYAIRALKSGATDYVLKTNLVRLPAAVERALQDRRSAADRKLAEAALRESEERFRGILEGAADGIAVVDAAGRLQTINPQFAAIFGYSADELRASEITALIPTELRAGHGGHFAGYFAAPRSRRMSGGPIVGLRKDGGRVDLEVSLSPMKTRQGAMVVICIVRDVTEQMDQRRRLARLSRIREFSSSINQALVRVRAREALFGEICRIAVEIGGLKGSHIGLADPQTGDVEWVCRFGSVSPSMEIATSARGDLEQGQGLAGRALRSRKPAVWNDVAREPDVRNRERFVGHGIGAIGTFPLLVEGRPIGVFSLHAREAGFFDQDEISLLEELVSNISFALELLAKQERLNYLAYHDPLTGLANHARFHDRLTESIEGAKRAAEMMALMVLDVERFKAINDTLGRQTGDRVLQALARRLHEAAGDPGRVARLGSDVFAVMFPDIGAAQEAARRLDRDAAKFVGLPFEIDGHEVRLAVRAGIAVYPADGADAAALFRNAEASLKRAKETGERCLFYAPQINARIAEQVDLENRLRKAVERGEILLHYQPKLDLATRKIVGLEALMRWKGPDGVPVSPVKFIPVLEQTGLILEAGRQAIAAATAAYRTWQGNGLNPPRVAVNVSALQLRRRSFVGDVRAALGDLGADGGGVDIEITESLLMTEVNESIRKLKDLRGMGLCIALDDFGTGYSSLAYLSKLPLDSLKIDRGFVHGMTENADDTSLVSTIISLAQSLRLKVVAEGVESEQQAQLLRLLRCDQVQGYLFSPPVSAERIEALLVAQKA